MRVVNVDRAGDAFARYRFFRSLVGGALLFEYFPLVLIAFVSGYFVTEAATYVLQAQGIPRNGALNNALAIATWIVWFFFASALTVSLASLAVTGVERIHRRITSFVGVAFYIALICLILFWGYILASAGVDLVRGAYHPPIPLAFAFLILAFCVASLGVVAAISIEMVWGFLWSMWAPRALHLAMRGWRPPPLRLASNARRQLGVPSFVSAFGRHRVGLTLLYLAMGALNTVFVFTYMSGASPIFVADSFGWLAPPGSLNYMGRIAGEAGSGPAQRDSLLLYAAIPAGLLVLLSLLNVMGLGRWLARLARARAIRLYQTVQEWDARAPIVFLRSFAQDAAELHSRVPVPYLKWPAGLGRGLTIDEVLLEAGSPYGPVVAIGDPHDPIPPLGAARIFVEGAGTEWQQVVKGLVQAADAVVICPNRTVGVKWELNLVSDAAILQRAIYISNPELETDDANSLFADIMGCSLGIDRAQRVIAAFKGRDNEWCVVTGRTLSTQTLNVALTYALQALLGYQGKKLARPRAARL